MPLDPEFVADCPYGTGGLLLDEILTVDANESLVRARTVLVERRGSTLVLDLAGDAVARIGTDVASLSRRPVTGRLEAERARATLDVAERDELAQLRAIEAEGHVRATSDDGRRLETERLVWDGEVAHATGGVRLRGGDARGREVDARAREG